MGKYVAHFEEFGLNDIADVGGKGANLGELAQAGFHVPPGFCIKADSFDRFLAANRLHEPIADLASVIDYHHIKDVEEKTARIRAMIIAAKIPDDILLEIQAAHAHLQGNGGEPLVAVRSSVGTRDLSRSSFPGQMDTYHNLHGIRAVLRCVRECWASVWSARAAATIHANQIDYKMVFIAPLVQLMVPADKAGVVFTANPVNSCRDELLIDASYGLGEAVVGGDLTPDHYVICKKEKRIISIQPGNKRFKIVLDAKQGFGNRKIDLTEEEASREALQPNQIRELIDLGLSIEDYYASAQDIEWAYAGDKLYVLQSRRIQGLLESQAEDRPAQPNPNVVWSRKFGDEYLADYAMPLNYSLLVRWISEDYFKDIARLQGREDLAGLEPLRRYNGYVYMSGLYIARLLRPIPRRFRIMDSLDWFPASWNDRILAEPFQPYRFWGTVRSIRNDPRAGVLKNQKALQMHCANIEKQLIPKLSQDYTRLSKDEWRQQFDEVNELGREHFRVIRWGVGFNNPLFHNVLIKLLQSWTDDTHGKLYQAIISGLPGTRTAKINQDIWRLGQMLRDDLQRDVKMMSLFKKKNISYKELRQARPEARFWSAFDTFLEQHGHRAATRELSQPRWRETPEVILNLVRAQLQSKERLPDPETLARKSLKKRQEAEKKALARASSGVAGYLKRPLLKWVYQTTQAYTIYRENQRYHLDYIQTHMRELLLEQGRRLADKGVLEDRRDVFFLEADEFWPQVAQPRVSKALRSKIKERHQHYLEWKDRLPAAYLYDDTEVIDESSPIGGPISDTSDVITGLAASSGWVQGPVRVIGELKNLDQIKAGEILVTNNIDPGWTNVFPFIGGLVTETGGLLAHGALLAREYGIPAVMGISEATKRFRTGNRIEVNGSEGYIRMLKGLGYRRSSDSVRA